MIIELKIAADFWFALAPARFAFYYRARGGAISLGDNKTNLARLLFWVIPTIIETLPVCYFMGFPLWYALICGVMAFASVAAIGHASEQGDTAEAHEEMGLVTTAMLILILSPLAFAGVHYHMTQLPLYLMPLGYLGALMYWLGYKMKSDLNLFGIKWCTAGDASWGEWFTGAAPFGLAIMILGLSAV